MTVHMPPVKAALLGAEHPHSFAHLQTLQVLKEVDSVFLWDEDESALAALQRSQVHKVEGVYTDLDALLARDDISFAIVCVRTDLEPNICLRVLAAGKHIMAEKPIGRTAADVARVVVAAERAGLQLGVCYINRRHPVVEGARSLVDKGLLGPIISIEMRILTTQVRCRNPEHWLFSKARAGGGMLSWLGCHYVDMMRYVAQDEIVSVSADVATRSGEDIDVEDVATLSLRFRSGAIGSLHTGYVLALSGEGYHNKQGYDIYAGFNGRAGRLYWNPRDARFTLHAESTLEAWRSAPKRAFTYSVAETAAYGGAYGEAFLRDFVWATLGQGAVPATGRDALQVARIVDAAYESSRTGRRIEIGVPVED